VVASRCSWMNQRPRTIALLIVYICITKDFWSWSLDSVNNSHSAPWPPEHKMLLASSCSTQTLCEDRAEQLYLQLSNESSSSRSTKKRHHKAALSTQGARREGILCEHLFKPLRASCWRCKRGFERATSKESSLSTCAPWSASLQLLLHTVEQVLLQSGHFARSQVISVFTKYQAISSFRPTSPLKNCEKT
jgi:hypothetical protein